MNDLDKQAEEITKSCNYADCCGGKDLLCDHVNEFIAQKWYGDWVDKMCTADKYEVLGPFIEKYTVEQLGDFFTTLDVYMEIDLRENDANP